MDDQMPKAVQDGAEQAEEVVEQSGEHDGASKSARQDELDAARDVTGGADLKQPKEPPTTVD